MACVENEGLVGSPFILNRSVRYGAENENQKYYDSHKIRFNIIELDYLSHPIVRIRLGRQFAVRAALDQWAYKAISRTTESLAVLTLAV